MTMKTSKVLIETNDEEENDEVKSESDEDEEISDNEEEVNDSNEGGTVNMGWADSIAKILKSSKPKGKKAIVLSKAKKIVDVKKVKVEDAGFEIEAKDGQIKQECIELGEEIDEPLRKRRKDLPCLRVKVNILHKDRERTLSKIATKGVIQLFNAVKKQQNEIEGKLKAAGSLEVKRDKILKNIDKREFLNVLMGGNAGTSDMKHENKVLPSNDEPTWSVLKDEFMMSAKMKDWDKQLEDDEDVEIKDEDSD
ncbi:hypothetical protein FQA39_LY07906 [Lamprigera yunnana]|nr:hypothetical protein FQA39_LY07906 [Lamprigera yunnana]